MKGCSRICRRASAQSQSSKASAESYCIPRIVEGQSACSSRKGGIVVALLYVAVDRQRQRAKPSEPTYVDRGGSEENYFFYLAFVCLFLLAVMYLFVNRCCYLLPVRGLCAIFAYSRDDVNFARTNLWIAKYHSAEIGDTLRGSSTAIPRIAAQKLCEVHAEFPWISSDFVKFLVTSTVSLPSYLRIMKEYCHYSQLGDSIKGWETISESFWYCTFASKKLWLAALTHGTWGGTQ